MIYFIRMHDNGGDMELRELRSFCTAARVRSISRAADILGMGQPTVTTHIKKLETELGATLFDRFKRPIQLTPVGKTLAEVATPLVEGIDALAQTAADAEERGPVVVASTPDIIPHTLLRVVRVFLARHPHIHLRINSTTRREVLHRVINGQADMGIVAHDDRDDQLDFEGLFVYDRVLITPPDHPLLDEPLESLAQVAKWPLILMGPGTHTREILEAELRRRGASYEIIVELDSLDMIKRYVALGMGVSIGPKLAIDPQDEEELGVVSLTHLLPVEQGGIVTVRGKRLSTAAGKFATVMRDTLAAARQTAAGRR
jgi:DNA-binding transcriptional LysR family regulator|tara:strand:+ start:580 stop:1524 length:945 start_codon:yes stop_codon:yes gene_type:complete